MKLKTNLRPEPEPFEYSNDWVLPDQGLTIGDIIERHLDASSVSNHQNEAFEDTNIDNPTLYDSDLTDTPTIYQDKEYFDTLEMHRRSFTDAAVSGGSQSSILNNNHNEKGTAMDSSSVSSDSPAGSNS